MAVNLFKVKIMNKVLTDYYELRKDYDEALGDLENATLRIIKILKKVFNCSQKTWWSFKYYENSDDAPPQPSDIRKDSKYGDSFPIHISEECDSGVWFYHEEIPVKFFDMTDQEIEDYIKKEIHDFKEKEKAQKIANDVKKLQNLSKKNAIKESAIKKLTKEERKALGI